VAGRTTLVAHDGPRVLGALEPTVMVREAEKATGSWAGRRVLSVSGQHAFGLSFWCGTCPFLFERLEGANRTLSIEEVQARFNAGLTEIDRDVVGPFADLLERGEYLSLLLEIEPTLVHPIRAGDYFAEEQVATWGTDGFWGLPEYPRTPYYRGDTRALDNENRLFEFVVPMVPPSWNDRATVAAHVDRLRRSSVPTCVAVGLLDVRQRAVAQTPDERLIHWGLSHFLLDGHHKIEAAAQAGARLQVLSLVPIDNSLAERTAVERLGTIFGTPQ
jgi:hypothetical protein